MFIRAFQIFFVILATAIFCNAQKWPVIRYIPLQGLSGMQCISVFRDSRGYIWAGTKSGLNRFNGEKFKQFHIKDGLLSDYVTIIGEDSKGYLWFNCNHLGLVRYDGKTFKKFLFPSPFYGQGYIGQDDAIIVDGDKKLYQIQSDTLLPIKWQFPKNANNNVSMIAYHPTSKKYLMQIGDSLFTYQKSKWKMVEKLSPNHSFNFIKQIGNDIVLTVVKSNEEKNHILWNGNDFVPFIKTSLPHKIEVINTLKHDYIFEFNGVGYLLEKNTKSVHQVLKNTTVNSVEQYDAGSLIHYIATEKGLIGIAINGFKNFDEEEVPNTWSVVEDKSGGMYFLNFRQPLQYFNGKQISTITYNIHPFSDNLINVKNIDWYYDAIKDKNNTLWLPSSIGIFINNNNKWEFKRFPIEPAYCFALAENKNQNMIIAGSENRIYLIENKPPYKFRNVSGNEPIFKSSIVTVAVAPDGSYWFGGYGVARYDSLQKSIKYYNRDNKKIEAGGITSLFFDNRSTLWAGSFRKGLFRFNPKTDSFERYYENWLNGMISFIEQLDKDHLLVADFNNLYVIDLNNPDKNAPALKIFNHHNGFMGVEPGQLGSYRDSKGKIWITSGTVLSVLDPSKLNLKQSKLRTFITQIDTVSIPFVGNIGVQKLAYGQNSVSFVVESLGEDKPFQTQFSYRLKGVQDNWSAWQTQDLISFTNLSNDVYTLEVKSRNGTYGQGVESEITSLQFEVNLPFYRSPNFYKYASLVGILLIFGLLYSRFREQSKNKLISTREKQVGFLKSQAFLSQMNAHFINNVLGSIKYLVESQNTKDASENLQKFADLIRRQLEATLLKEDASSSLYEREIPLSEEIEFLKLYIELQQLRHNNLFEYQINIDGKINIKSYRIPPLLLQPFIENAIVHGLHNKGGNGHLIINFVQINEDELLCTIEDDGVGRQTMKDIQANSFRKFKSRGTELIKQRIKILNESDYNISISTADRVNGGTVVTIKIGYI